MNDHNPASRPSHSASSSRSKNSQRFLIFLTCLFTSSGQLAIDIYVPALPAMARYFQTSPQAIQSSVSGFMAAYAFGQLVFGPVADAYGRLALRAVRGWPHDGTMARQAADADVQKAAEDHAEEQREDNLEGQHCGGSSSEL